MVENSLNCPGPWERLLVCTDGSEGGQHAVTQALALGRACAGKVYVLQVVKIIPEFEAVAPDLRVCLEEEIEGQKESAAAAAARQGVEMEYRILHSISPFADIVAEAEKLKPQLIIIGRYGRTSLTRLFMGSIAARVIGLSPVNVLVIPREDSLAFRRL